MHRESPQRLEKRLLQELSAGIAGLARAEDDAGLAYRGELAAARERAEQARRAADAAFHTEQRGVNQELSSAREAIESRAGAERQ